LYHLRARQYDPAIGRFQRPDPLDPDLTSRGISAYVFADDRPTLMTDPTGEHAEPTNAGKTHVNLPSSPVDPQQGDPSNARRLSSYNPNAGNNCTTVADAIGFGRVKIIDFSPSCKGHDECYGTWDTNRKSCDDTFHDKTKGQCKSTYGSWWKPWERYLRRLCDDWAGFYHEGVRLLGGNAWLEKAYRLDGPKPGIDGCPWPARLDQKTVTDESRCLYAVDLKNYPPWRPDYWEMSVRVPFMYAKLLHDASSPPI
jgi:hypothetical protein